MDPQPKNKQEIQSEVKQDKIIAMMRVTKKTDPLFKPLKKLKNAVESIGYDKISIKPTKIVILFHFGLGNDLDLEFIKKTNVPEGLLKKNVILPGKSYCYLNFDNQKQAQNYTDNNFKQIIQGFTTRFTQIQHQKLSRVMISIFAIDQGNILQQQLANIIDTALHYIPNTIPGISLIENFITKQQQLQLLEHIDKAQWSRLNNRRVQHYGHQFKYGRNQIDRDQKFNKPLPQFMQRLLQRLQKLQLLPGYRFDQITINDYFPGDGIPAHFDTHSPFQEYFVAISMLSGIVMEWRKYDGNQKQVYLPARSLIIFAGQGRYAWTHGISCRKLDKLDGTIKYRSRRLSITLRKIKYTQCKCPYYFYCDSQGYDQKTMKKNNPLLIKYIAQNINNKKLIQKPANQIYKKYVLQAYNGFGFDFHNRSIEKVQQLLTQYLNRQNAYKQCQIILDVGCGNGQYKQFMQNHKYNNNYEYIGIQICKTMKQIQNKIHMDGLSLSFRQKSFNIILCIAVLHHMVNIQQRLTMLKQMKRVLNDNGVVIITVFGYQQKSNIYKQQDILLDYCVSHNKINQNRNGQNVYKGGKEGCERIEKRGEVFSRYYHLFKEDQVRYLCKQAGLKIIKLSVDKQNIILVAAKQIIQS